MKACTSQSKLILNFEYRIVLKNNDNMVIKTEWVKVDWLTEID